MKLLIDNRAAVGSAPARSFALPTTNDLTFPFGGAARSILETRFPCSSEAGFLRLPIQDGAHRPEARRSSRAAVETRTGGDAGGAIPEARQKMTGSGSSRPGYVGESGKTSHTTRDQESPTATRNDDADGQVYRSLSPRGVRGHYARLTRNTSKQGHR